MMKCWNIAQAHLLLAICERGGMAEADADSDALDALIEAELARIVDCRAEATELGEQRARELARTMRR